MQWPKNDGNKLDDDPTMTKFMVGVLVRFNSLSSSEYGHTSRNRHLRPTQIR